MCCAVFTHSCVGARTDLDAGEHNQSNLIALLLQDLTCTAIYHNTHFHIFSDLSPSRIRYQAFNFVLRFAVQAVCDNILACKRAHLLDIRLGDSIGSRPRVDLVRMNAVVLVESKCMRACR